MKPFVLNSHGGMVFPSSSFPDLDFSVFASLEQFAAVIARDFEAKAPTGTDLADRIASSGYPSRFELLRDLGLNLFWLERYAMTMYDKRPTRWRDVPKSRDDVFLPMQSPWEDGERKIAAVAAGYRSLPTRWDAAVEDHIFGLLFDVFGHRRHHATELPAIKPTVAELRQDPRNRTFVLPAHDPDYPVFSDTEILDYSQDVPELEALGRWAMVIHNQYPWERSRVRLVEVGDIDDDDFVVLFHPRNREVLDFIRRVRSTDGRRVQSRPYRDAQAALGPVETRQPVRPYPPVEVRKHFTVMPRLEALAVVKGEYACTNDDVIRNTAYNWSPMSAQEIRDKTGIQQRLYTERGLEDIALEAAKAALDKAGRSPEDVGAVLFCSCTSTRLIPSVATWLSGELGMFQTHASCDLVAACAGLPYGLAEAVRLLQEVERPVLLVCAEKFSDKIGSVRTSRMIFGDGAAAVVMAPAVDGEPPDVEVVQTYAGGPVSEVNSIIWPNPAFDNNITVYGPEVRRLVERYLMQMMAELQTLPGPAGEPTMLAAIDLIVPHQANKTMVVTLAEAAGISPDQLYFNIERMGNVSSASIPLAIHDAVADGVIDRPMLVFAPGFGAGAVGGYAILRIDPAIVAVSAGPSGPAGPSGTSAGATPTMVAVAPAWATSSDDVQAAFGG
jgi:3-oxoacyl-[acyl-carrier-protein] synthase III